jgi:hypothetical protein
MKGFGLKLKTVGMEGGILPKWFSMPISGTIKQDLLSISAINGCMATQKPASAHSIGSHHITSTE